MKFFRCELCGNLITMVEESGVLIECCGQDMTELVANTSDGAGEKHVPVVQFEGNSVCVKVGEAEHPMMEKHFIQWVALETEGGIQIKYLKPGVKPEACFAICEGETVLAVYEYCNIHGLWKTEL